MGLLRSSCPLSRQKFAVALSSCHAANLRDRARQSSWSRQVTPERPPLQLPKYGRFSCDHMHLACIWHAMGSHLNRFRPKRERPAHVLHVVRGGPDVKHMWILERIVVTSNQHNPQIAARPCQLQCCTSGLGRC